MKRRILITETLSHESRVLFLDEPTAGVDVDLCKDMWDTVAGLKADGVTIILTTHYIEEAEAVADRVGVISKGELLLIEGKDALMHRFGQTQLRIELQIPLSEMPQALLEYDFALIDDGQSVIYSCDAYGEGTGITNCCLICQRLG